MEKDYIVSLGSVTKFIISFLLLKLIHDNSSFPLTLNDDFSKWFPEYKNWHSIQGKKLKIFHLLNMKSGIPEYFSDDTKDFFIKNENRIINPEELLNLIRNKNLVFKPGEKEVYSNTNYVLIGILIEKILKDTIHNILNKNIFEPFELNNTFFVNGNDFFNYNDIVKQSTKLLSKDFYFQNYSFLFSSGAIVSTLSDVYKLLSIIFKNDEFIWYRDLLNNSEFCELNNKISNDEPYYCFGMIKTNNNSNLPFFTHSGTLYGEYKEQFYFIFFPNIKNLTVMTMISKEDEISLEDLFFNKILINLINYKEKFFCR